MHTTFFFEIIITDTGIYHTTVTSELWSLLNKTVIIHCIYYMHYMLRQILLAPHVSTYIFGTTFPCILLALHFMDYIILLVLYLMDYTIGTTYMEYIIGTTCLNIIIGTTFYGLYYIIGIISYGLYYWHHIYGVHYWHHMSQHYYWHYFSNEYYWHYMLWTILYYWYYILWTILLHQFSYIIIPHVQNQGQTKEFFLYGDTPTSKVDYYTSTITPLCSKWT